MAERPHVLIIGGGFGGLWAARRLGGKAVDVTLIDRCNFHTFFPLLYQIAAAEIEAVEIAYPIRGILRRHHNVRFLMAEAWELEPDRKRLHTNRGTLSYDYVILATGSTPHFFGIPGGHEHAFPLRTLEDGLAQRNHILARFEKAVQEEDDEERRGTLRFVIVGGGPTGVEFAGALAELLFGPLAKDYPGLKPDVSVVLVEARDRLLPEMPAKLGRYAARRLAKMGVQVRLGARVNKVTPTEVELEGEPPLRAETVTWTAGMQGDPLARRWGLPTTRQGRVRVTPSLQLEERPELFVVGDLAHFEERDAALPMVAPVAIQQGERAARNILRLVRGDVPRPFHHRDRGMLATIGRNAGVAHIHGRRFTGFFAWTLWLGIHIVKLIGFRNRLAVLLNWGWDYFFFERAVRLILPIGRSAPPANGRDAVKPARSETPAPRRSAPRSPES